MPTTTPSSSSLDNIESFSADETNALSFDDEVLNFWAERARIQLSAMNAMTAYLN